MKLKKYGGKRVRITTRAGEAFEGVCTYNDKEYNECEFGRAEESLGMPYFIFYKKDVKKIEPLPDTGPYGGYSGRYGLLEETAVRDGADAIEEVLLSEEDEHIYRLLLCIEDHLSLGTAGDLPPIDTLAALLRSVPTPGSRNTDAQLQRVISLLCK